MDECAASDEGGKAGVVTARLRPKGGLARGRWRGAEGVTGHFPLEWVAPHAVGARERLFPPNAVIQKRRTPSGGHRRGYAELILARQHHHVVREVEGDFIQWEIGELDFLGEDDSAIAIVANQRGGVGSIDLETPRLKFFGGDGWD